MTSIEISFGNLADRLLQSWSFSNDVHKTPTLLRNNTFSDTPGFITKILQTMRTIRIGFFDKEVSQQISDVIFIMYKQHKDKVYINNIDARIIKQSDLENLRFSISNFEESLTVNLLTPIQRINKANEFFSENVNVLVVDVLRPFFENVTMEETIILSNHKSLTQFVTKLFEKHVQQSHLIVSPKMLSAFWDEIKKYRTVSLFLHLSPAVDDDGPQKYWIQMICKENRSSLLVGVFNFF